MILKLRIIVSVFIFCGLFNNISLAQDIVTSPMGYNPKLINAPKIALKRTLDTLTLPFIEDFSTPGPLPRASHWTNNQVYINNDFAVNPLSLGVATFDGLNANGMPYSTNINAYGAADTLTSVPINLALNPSDSVYLSFVYQPQGLGRSPESRDSLTLQFFNVSTNTWKSIWKKAGSTVYPFKQQLVAVRDTQFLKKGFQFRFINYASLIGADDQWHLDYVQLNKNRDNKDTVIVDAAFTGNIEGSLMDYTAMPFNQFTTGNLNASGHTAEIRNNFNLKINLGFPSVVTERPSNTVIQDFSQLADNFEKLTTVNKTFAKINYNNLGSYAVLEHKHNIDIDRQQIPDIISTNDTIVYNEVLGNYFSYDDGTAEEGFGLTTNGGKIAYEFTLNKSDSLQVISAMFAQIGESVKNLPFKLTVWTSLSPETIVYQSTISEKVTYNGTNGFVNFTLNNAVFLPQGKFYIGWEQQTTRILNIGLDRNNDQKSKLQYKLSTSGSWIPSSTEGSIMLRPIFGERAKLSVKNNAINKLPLYPNPAYENIFIENKGIGNISIININGSEVISKQIISTNENIQINIEDLPAGIYQVAYTTKEGYFNGKLSVIK